MKILFVSNYLQDSQESMQRFANLLEACLPQAGIEVRRISPPVMAGRVKGAPNGARKWLGYVDKFVIFPQLLKRAVQWADIVHICDHSNSMYTHYLRSVPNVVTCHDMLAVRSALGEIPQNRTRWSGCQLQHMVVRGLKSADHITCVSRATRDDLLRITQVKESRVSLIYNGLNYAYSPMERGVARLRTSRLGLPADRQFLLHVGGNQWYKNRLGVLKLFREILKHDAQDRLLVMLGKDWTAAMEEFASRHCMQARVMRLANVENEDLRAFYSTADALLFPSIQEGFGWPIIEAQACGCLVFTSNRAPMNEVGGDAAIYIDPNDVISSTRVILSTLNSGLDYRDASIANAMKFDASIMAAEYLKTYESVIRAKQ